MRSTKKRAQISFPPTKRALTELHAKRRGCSIPLAQNLDELEAAMRRWLDACIAEDVALWVSQVEENGQKAAGDGYVSKGWYTSVVSPGLDELSIRRRKFCNPLVGEIVVPLDWFLGTARESKTVREIGIRFASGVSFAKASKFLRLSLRSDGGAWFGTLFESLPLRVAHQLDLHHLLARLRESVRALRGSDQGDGKGLRRRLRRRAAGLKDQEQFRATLPLIECVGKTLGQDR